MLGESEELGGKARGLARMASLGLTVPAGFVITDGLFRALVASETGSTGKDIVDPRARALAHAGFPPGFLDELKARLAALGTTSFSVRSSFALEDAPGEVAAGIYDSVIGVAAAAVPGALRRVLASALAPPAQAYGRLRARPLAQPPVSVLVHAYVPGAAHGGVAAWPGGDLLDVHEGTLSPEAHTTIMAGARTAATQFGAVELEWVADGDAVTFLQLRPFLAPSTIGWAGFADLPPDEREGAWSWDAAHNPAPLSAAHAGLVAFVDERCRIGYRQRVLGGYLFYRSSREPGGEPRSLDLEGEIRTLDAAIAEHVERLGSAPALADALATFATFYQPLLGEIGPAARRARRSLRRFLDRHVGTGPGAAALEIDLLSAVASRETRRRELVAALRAADDHAAAEARAAYLDEFGDEAPGWDIALPTWKEVPATLGFTQPQAPQAPTPPAVDWQSRLAQVAKGLPDSLADELRQLVEQGRAAVAAGEDDDWLYARLQAPVRRAVLGLGQRLTAEGRLQAVDVFDLSLATLRRLDGAELLTASELKAEADQNRAKRLAAQLDPPPAASLGRGHSLPGLVRGHGVGGRTVGRVALRQRGGAPLAPDSVLVATSLLPTELPLLHVAALVTETGGPLDHVATQARERGLPAIVGARGATGAFQEGELVMVDGPSGLVTAILPRGTSP